MPLSEVFFEEFKDWPRFLDRDWLEDIARLETEIDCGSGYWESVSICGDIFGGTLTARISLRLGPPCLAKRLSLAE